MGLWRAGWGIVTTATQLGCICRVRDFGWVAGNNKGELASHGQQQVAMPAS